MDILAHKKEIREIALKYNLKFMVIFGGLARGKIHLKSDVDIAVSFGDPNDEEVFHKELQITSELAYLLERDDIDMVNVARISPTLMRSIADEGVLIFEKSENLYNAWKVLAYNVWFDSFKFREARDAHLLKWVKKYDLNKHNV